MNKTLPCLLDGNINDLVFKIPRFQSRCSEFKECEVLNPSVDGEKSEGAGHRRREMNRAETNFVPSVN